jgi:hypothetical protein
VATLDLPQHSHHVSVSLLKPKPEHHVYPSMMYSDVGLQTPAILCTDELNYRNSRLTTCSPCQIFGVLIHRRLSSSLQHCNTAGCFHNNPRCHYNFTQQHKRQQLHIMLLPVLRYLVPVSASAAAACCAIAGSLWLRWCRITWRHTGSSSGACTAAHEQHQQHKARRHGVLASARKQTPCTVKTTTCHR